MGKSLSAELTSEWILSHHLCNTLSMLMDSWGEKHEAGESVIHTAPHKEEGGHRRLLYATDQAKISDELSKHVNALVTHHIPLCNIINGRIAPVEVNVDTSYDIGQQMAAQFISSLPHGFYKPISKRVVTMETMKKGVKIGNSHTYDMEKLYAMLLVVSQHRDIRVSDLFKYELSPVPPSLFDEYGDMRKASKVKLVHKVEVFTDTQLDPIDAELIDGNEAIYHTLRSRNISVDEFANNFVTAFDIAHPTYILFDRYDKNSIKSHERQRRAKSCVPRQYVLSCNTILPARDVFMKSDANKTQLIKCLCNVDINNPHLHLIGDTRVYQHEEADVKIISYLLQICPHHKHVQVLADDADIFVMLVYFIWYYKALACISMRKYNGKIIDITTTVAKLGNKCSDILRVHALSGCDTVSYPYGKGMVVNLMLKLDLDLSVFADSNSEEGKWMAAGICFLSLLYWGNATESLNDLRYRIFSNTKESQKKQKNLPPTDETAREHVKRARLQVLIWRAADEYNIPRLECSRLGWIKEDDIMVPIHGNVSVAPNVLLQHVACGCKSDKPCSRATCSCRSAKMPCTSYCKCKADEQCANDNVKHMDQCDNSEHDCGEEWDSATQD